MKRLKADPIHEAIEQTQTYMETVVHQMQAIQTALQGLEDTQADFKGATASAIRSFFRDVHLPLAVYLEGCARAYQDVLREVQESLDNVDSSNQAVLDESFLQAFQEDLHHVREKIAELTADANDQLRSVMDIVEVSTVSDENFQWGADYLDKKANRLTESIHAFDADAIKQLTSTEEDLKRAENYIQEITTMTSNHQLIPSSYKPNQVNQLDSHHQLLAGLSQKVISKDYFLDYFFSFVHPMNIVQAMAGVHPAFLLYRSVQEVDQEKEVTREYRDVPCSKKTQAAPR
ncbi:LXG domain-containing protein [Oceanobacillus timonensis]|uniref:LXG domain-containing protein n=1 Tax=Oceanobacillus timonensis TaxID=1926285 RepID=UPI0015C4D9AA|nr:LXG domain-containing protein [Oceanobacillus timonensis]